MKKGSFLLVVDPASSFSEFQVQGQDTTSTYKLFNLLDAIQAFECVAQSDSEWYRFPKDLDFPLKLNNMRYYFRLYKKK
jgi:25S rRNA (uracil2843-N3)-methyltransferase